MKRSTVKRAAAKPARGRTKPATRAAKAAARARKSAAPSRKPAAPSRKPAAPSRKPAAPSRKSAARPRTATRPPKPVARSRKSAADATFVAFVLDQLSSIPEVRSRSMFGGDGVYAGTTFFAVIDEGRLYFRVDDESRADYESRGMGPFNPMGSPMLGYWEVPPGVIDDARELERWARRAIAAKR